MTGSPACRCSRRGRPGGLGNQAELLARALGRRLGIPYEALLVQTRGEKGAAHHKEERAANVRGVYAPKAPSRICGRRILLCDDIVTTGSTLRECGRALSRAGAEEVFFAPPLRRWTERRVLPGLLLLCC